MLERVWKKGTLLHCWWERKLVQPLWRTVWIFLKKLKIELPYDPAIPLLDIYLEKMKSLIWKDTYISVFIPALFVTAKTRKQPKCPQTEEWIKKIWCIYAMKYDSAIKKEKNDGTPSNMDGSRNYHTKWSKSDRQISGSIS